MFVRPGLWVCGRTGLCSTPRHYLVRVITGCSAGDCCGISLCILRSFFACVLQTWQRPTLPRLETKYHQRWSVSRPSSEWDRVQPLRHNHQVGKTHVVREAFERSAMRQQPIGIALSSAFSELFAGLCVPGVLLVVAPFEAELRKVDRPSALMRRTHVAPPVRAEQA